MKLRHISIVARDADRLAAFYKSVFGYHDRGAPRHMSGAQVARGMGLAQVQIYAIWLELPGDTGPFLEIFQLADIKDRPAAAVNRVGYGHMAFGVPDIDGTIAAVLMAGGTLVGEVTNMGSHDAPHLCVYVSDPEGNILELEEV